MKPQIHPEYKEATVSCACGARSRPSPRAAASRVDICAECHPFYTGKQKIMDSAGRIERFQKKYKK